MAATAIVPSPPARGRAALQRRTLRVLVVAQLLSGLGGSAAVAASLLALEMTGSTSLASLPLALLVVGSSVVVVPISALSRRAGRRAGLATALALAAVGSVGIIFAATVDSFALLLVASVAFGAGNVAVMLARYAAADLSTAAQRGRAIGTVVFATTFGAVAGPNLLEPAGHLATALGLPGLTGLYVVATAAFVLAGLVLFAFLRPDPLQIATALREPAAGIADAGSRPATAARVPLRVRLAAPGATAGLITMVVANFVMVAVMAMAPVHLHDHGHGLTAVGLVVSLHVAGMFAPAPLTGWLTDRVGPFPVAGGAAVLLLVAGVLSAVAGGGVVTFGVGLAILGVGWNAGLVAGSTLLAGSVPITERPRAEGIGELGMGVTAASATAIAGPLVGLAGYATLAVAAAIAAATLGPILLAAARRGVPASPPAGGRLPA